MILMMKRCLIAAADIVDEVLPEGFRCEREFREERRETARERDRERKRDSPFSLIASPPLSSQAGLCRHVSLPPHHHCNARLVSESPLSLCSLCFLSHALLAFSLNFYLLSLSFSICYLFLSFILSPPSLCALSLIHSISAISFSLLFLSALSLYLYLILSLLFLCALSLSLYHSLSAPPPLCPLSLSLSQ